MASANIDNLNGWGAGNEDQRFRRIWITTCFVFLVLSLIVPLMHVPKLTYYQKQAAPPRVAQLMLQQPKAAKPKPEAKAPAPSTPKPKPKPVHKAKAKPTPKPHHARPKTAPKPHHHGAKHAKPSHAVTHQKKVQAARRKAQHSGLLAAGNQLSSLRNNPAASHLNARQHLSKNGAQPSSGNQPSAIDSEVDNGSGGISTGHTGHNIGPREQLPGHHSERVATASGASHRHPHAHGSGHAKVRSDKEIQAVFDRNKGALYNLYNRALRRNPTLQGKLVLKLTIASSGRVTHLSIVSSQLGDPALAQKIKTRVSLFNFGAKNVPKVTIVYPLTFVPS